MRFVVPYQKETIFGDKKEIGNNSFFIIPASIPYWQHERHFSVYKDLSGLCFSRLEKLSLLSWFPSVIGVSSVYIYAPIIVNLTSPRWKFSTVSIDLWRLAAWLYVCCYGRMLCISQVSLHAQGSLNTKGVQCKCGKSYLDRRIILSGFELLVV